MPTTNDKLELIEDRWFGWQMLPGYIHTAYFSPIFVKRILPRKTGRRILRLELINAFYTEGVQDFSMDLRILKHEAGYLVAELLYGGESSDRTAVVTPINFPWLQGYCPHLLDSYPPQRIGGGGEADVQHYLSTIYRGTN